MENIMGRDMDMISLRTGITPILFSFMVFSAIGDCNPF